jgi:hypothetical protein
MNKYLQTKKRILLNLQKSLEVLARKTEYAFSLDYLDEIHKNEKRIKILTKIDSILQNAENIEKNLLAEILEITENCKQFQERVEKNWEIWTKETKTHLNEIEIRNQLKEYLKKRNI